MKHANELKKISQKNSPLIAFFEDTIVPSMEAAAEKGEFIYYFEIPQHICPGFTHRDRFEVIKDYVAQFGYKMNCSAKHIISIEWD